MEPARSIIEFLGGARVVAGIVGKHVSRVYRWTYPESAREGTGGLIPAREQRRLLEFAKCHSIDLVASDFHDESRILELMAARSASREAAE
ncbi:hypothetical protein [Rhizobium sp. G21]|uniref:hypothetical protein n=1 Tax=Rhizobium sp. G21 TaxID=2758439 RepID=UPI001FEDBF57|nr:hypothetical protein [Rhizobium sp. G21]